MKILTSIESLMAEFNLGATLEKRKEVLALTVGILIIVAERSGEVTSGNIGLYEKHLNELKAWANKRPSEAVGINTSALN